MTAFQIDFSDNVATALEPLSRGTVVVRGDALIKNMQAVTDVPVGHKIALRLSLIHILQEKGQSE